MQRTKFTPWRKDRKARISDKIPGNSTEGNWWDSNIAYAMKLKKDGFWKEERKGGGKK